MFELTEFYYFRRQVISKIFDLVGRKEIENVSHRLKRNTFLAEWYGSVWQIQNIQIIYCPIRMKINIDVCNLLFDQILTLLDSNLAVQKDKN